MEYMIPIWLGPIMIAGVVIGLTVLGIVLVLVIRFRNRKQEHEGDSQ